MAPRSVSWLAILGLVTVVILAPGLTNAATESMPSEIRRALLLGDTDSAVVWLTTAVSNGNSDAAYELGKLYRLGAGVAKNRTKALELFRFAATAGHAEAIDLLAQVAPAGQSTTVPTNLGARRSDTEPSEDWFAWVNAARAPLKSISRAKYEIKNAAGTPLIVHVVEQGRVDWLTQLLSQKVNLAVFDAQGNGVLHRAVRSKDTSMLKALLAAGAPTNLRNVDGSSALHVAAALGNKAAVKRLLKAGSNLSEKNNSGWSAVMIAERSGSPDLLALFDRRSTGSSTRKAAAVPVSSESLLHKVRQGKLAQVKRLLDAGVSVDARNSGGDTALTLAVDRKHKDIVVALLAYGANVNLANDRGATPLHLAVSNGDEAVVRLLLKAKAKPDFPNAAQKTPVQLAVSRQCLPCLALLIGAQANLEATDKYGMTPLLEASKAGKKAFVQALLQAGVNGFAADNANHTSLWWAVRNRHSEVAYLLLEQPERLSVSKQKDSSGINPLHLAVQQEDVELVRRLATVDALNVPTATGSSPLLLAAHAGNNPVIELLLGLGAQVDQSNNLGDTALMEAIQQRSLTTTLQLVKAGASLNTHNVNGLSAKGMIMAIDDPAWTAVMDEGQGMFAAILKSLSD